MNDEGGDPKNHGELKIAADLQPPIIILQHGRTLSTRSRVRNDKRQQGEQAKKIVMDDEVNVINEVEDDISLHKTEDEIQPEEENSVSLIENIPELETDLSPSGRLDTIRQELDPEEEVIETTSIEERMSKFFD